MAGLVLLVIAAGPIPQPGAGLAGTSGAVQTSALVQEGVALLKANRVADAAERFAEAARQDPRSAEARYYLGIVREQQRDLAGAEAEYRQAVALAPLAAAHDRLGFVLGQRGKTEDAIAEFERAVAIDPNLADAQYHLGATRWWTKRPDLARAPLEAAVRLAPAHADARYYLGVTLRLLGNLDEALARLQEAIRLNPRLAPAHAYLGVVLRETGDLDGAVAA